MFLNSKNRPRTDAELSVFKMVENLDCVTILVSRVSDLSLRTVNLPPGCSVVSASDPVNHVMMYTVIDRSNSSQQQQPHPARSSLRIQPSLQIIVYDKTASIQRFYHQFFKQPTSEHHLGKRMPFDSPVQKTALNENTLLPLYPVLQESDLTDQDPNLSHHREQFLDHWKTLIDLEFKQDLERSKAYQTTSTTENIQQLQTQKQEASQATQNSLHFYTYYLLEKTLKVTDGVTAETIANATKTLKDDIVVQGGNTRTLDSLLQQLHTLHGKEKEFLFGTINVLQKESVIALIEDKKQISTLKFELSNAQKQLESNKKKAKSSKYTLSSSLEQLQENNEALKNSLEKANSRITDLEQNLEATLATESQLQNLLKRKEENNAAVETEGQEIINKLEGEKTRLIQKLSSAENQIKQVSETAEQLQKEIKVLADRLDKASTEKINLKKNLLDFTSKNKNLEKDLQELQDRVRGQENQIIILENRVKEYKKLQVKFIETEDSNDLRLDEDEPGEITKLVGDINELTLPTDSGDKSLHYELEIEQTNDFEQTIENLKTQIEHLNKTIIYLEQENQQLKKKVDMGVTHDDEDTSEKTFANTRKKNPKDDDIPATEQDDEDAKKVNRYFTQPIVKALGELFSREDKKAIPIFKGKSTDKLISEWLRGAEHVARNNEWDDNQKIRFFSDRLKGEAFEWHENYAEEEGDDLNYQDWKEALITRFQDTYDLATLEKKLSKLTQKPEENCRAFVSRLNNLYDTIAGKEERADHNQTIIEGQLLNKVKKMRDHRKSKILLQGLLPKYKAELYLRMPENTEDFDALCKQLFISEKILHTKEATDDKEMSAVIAGITHHEKQQDDKIQLLEQKLSDALSELKCTNTKRRSSQENDVTIAATDQYENRRPRPSER
ncbi:hypothetical protein OUZ56_016385 [Daphnia magna]|uniref:Ty3 transposon capsid-like protein domain-containing protein n=2 Tax=Daphnia magna TaxID=35525 RepID=A0ABR0AQW7_9CRUS|nr:hypothetical protein OUZ56_016385 [Daphnia magna]